MTRRRLLGILVAMVAWVTGSPALAAGAAPKQPLTFTIATPADGKAAALQCTVDFGPPLPIAALAFSPDGKWLAVGGYHEVLLWDLDQAKLARRLGTEQLHGMVHALVFVHGGKALAVGDGLAYERGSVRLFDVDNGVPTRTWEEPTKAVGCLAASGDGKRLAAGDGDGHVWVWDLEAGTLLKTLEAHSGEVRGVAFPPDGKHLVTGGVDQTMQLWDTNTWESVARYELSAPVQGVTFNPAGETILGAVGGAGQWGIATVRLEAALKDSPQRKPTARVVSTGGMPLDVVWPPRRSVYVACADHTIQAYPDGSGKRALTLSGHTDWVYGVACSSDGTKLASGSADGTVRLWNPTHGALLATLVQLTPNTDQWLLMTAGGYFATSTPKSLHWKSGSSPVATAEMNRRFESVEEVRKAISSAAFAAPPPRKAEAEPSRPSNDKPHKKKKG